VTERLLFAAVFVAVCAVGYLCLQGYLALRRRTVLRDTAETELSTVGSATLVAFSTVECARCRDQAHAISALASRLGGSVSVRKVDALAEPDLAERYGVMTVPTTVVLDGAGRPRAVNYGFAPERKLEAQVRAVLSGQPLVA
jgi:thioredoxin-like negative regulator of GroEL